MGNLKAKILDAYDKADSGSLYAEGKREAMRSVVSEVRGLHDLLPKFDEIDKRDAV